MRTFECPRGHVVESIEPFYWKAMGIPEHDWEEEPVVADSGPLCQICWVDWMRMQFPTKEVVER